MKNILDPGKAVPALGGALKTVGAGLKQAIIWNKIIEIGKYVGLLLTIIIVAYFVYKMVVARKK